MSRQSKKEGTKSLRGSCSNRENHGCCWEKNGKFTCAERRNERLEVSWGLTLILPTSSLPTPPSSSVPEVNYISVLVEISIPPSSGGGPDEKVEVVHLLQSFLDPPAPPVQPRFSSFIHLLFIESDQKTQRTGKLLSAKRRRGGTPTSWSHRLYGTKCQCLAIESISNAATYPTHHNYPSSITHNRVVKHQSWSYQIINLAAGEEEKTGAADLTSQLQALSSSLERSIPAKRRQ